MEGQTGAGDDLTAAIAARKELGPEYEDALVERFLEDVGRAIDERVDRRLIAETRAPAGRPLGLGLPLGSIALAIPITSVAASNLHGADSVAVIIASWVGIAAVNAAHRLGRRAR